MPSPHQKTMRPIGVNGPTQGGQILPQMPIGQGQNLQNQNQNQVLTQNSVQGQGQIPQTQGMLRVSTPGVFRQPSPVASNQNQNQRQMINLQRDQQLQKSVGQGQDGQTQMTQQQVQHLQIQQHTDRFYAGLGLGTVHPTVMSYTVQSMGLGGKEVSAMSDEERQQVIARYRATMQNHHRAMAGQAEQLGQLGHSGQPQSQQQQTQPGQQGQQQGGM
ncbi:hypothetical protein TREMEDRAFT_56862, partial [Tremella mesenterica DSM 1558]